MFYSKSIVSTKVKVVNGNYRGIGRPRKSDYSFMSPVEMQNYINRRLNETL